VSRRFAVMFILAALVAAVGAQSAKPSRSILKGVYDDANILYGDPATTFRSLRALRTKVIRVNMHWGGRFGVAGRFRTVRPRDPNDGQYDWRIYDRVVQYADENKIRVVFSIVSTPGWANGFRPTNVAPRRVNDLRDFAHAAAVRYSGTFQRPTDAIVLPAVRHWLAWNEPNNPVWLSPQAVRGRFVSPQVYARMCNAVIAGIRATLLRGQKVACGVTAPRGNNIARSSRASMSPLAFLRGMKRYGARGFDAYAHHPYYGHKVETPTRRPLARTALTIGNINDLDRELRRLYGAKRIWITEFGYQTTPPRDIFGVTRAQQARYLRQSYAIAKRHPRIDMFVWFLLKDDTRAAGWQSGFLTPRGARKPSFGVFRAL
jgi:Glycosyl hydrolase catalytic core